MKAFEFIKNYQLKYPDKMKMDIIKQLEMWVLQKQLEELYLSLNEDCDCESWMSIDEELFGQFVNWLSERGDSNEICRQQKSPC